MILIDCHSIRTNRCTGYERFAKAVLPHLGNRSNVSLISVGWNRVARALNLIPLYMARSKDFVVYPTNPPLYWEKKQTRNLIFIIHDIYPLLHPEKCQTVTSKKYTRFVCDVLENGFALAVSKFTSKQVADYFSINPIPVIGNHVEKPTEKRLSERLAGMRDNYGRYFLAVGTIEPRKNYRYLLDQYMKYLENSRKRLKLIVIGRPGWESDDLYSRLSNTRGVIWIKNACDRMLWAAYNDATALISTSLHEGFNMPAFEALYAGTQVVVPEGSAPTYEWNGFTTYRINTDELFQRMCESELNEACKGDLADDVKDMLENFSGLKTAGNLIANIDRAVQSRG